MTEELKNISQKISEVRNEISRDFGVSSIGVFGSYAKGRQTVSSDVDLLVEISKPIGLFDFIKLEMFLADVLKKKVDLVMKESLKPIIKDSILDSTIYI